EVLQGLDEEIGRAAALLQQLLPQELPAWDDLVGRLEVRAAALLEAVAKLEALFKDQSLELGRWGRAFANQVSERRAELKELAPGAALLREAESSRGGGALIREGEASAEPGTTARQKPRPPDQGRQPDGLAGDLNRRWRECCRVLARPLRVAEWTTRRDELLAELALCQENWPGDDRLPVRLAEAVRASGAARLSGLLTQLAS